MYPQQQPPQQQLRRPQMPMPRPPPKPQQSFLQKNKIFLLGGGIVFFLLMMILSLGAVGDGEDGGGTGFTIFGADPNILKTCEHDLNKCDETVDVRDAQLAQANKTISNNSTQIKTLQDKETQTLTDLSTCNSEKETLSTDFNIIETGWADCNTSLIDLNSDLNSFIHDYRICDANLTNTINKWTLAQNNYETCEDNTTSLENEVTDLQNQNTILSDANTSNFILYINCNSNLLDCQQERETDQNNFNYLITQTGIQITDVNVYDVSEVNDRIDAIKSLLCYFDVSQC